jgi:hypothetical protein
MRLHRLFFLLVVCNALIAIRAAEIGVGGEKKFSVPPGISLAEEKNGAAYVTVIVRGDVAAVKAAIEAGERGAAPLGTVIAAHVIARPHEDLAAFLPG